MGHVWVEAQPDIRNTLCCLPEQVGRVEVIILTSCNQGGAHNLLQTIFNRMRIFRLEGHHQIGRVLRMIE